MDNNNEQKECHPFEIPDSEDDEDDEEELIPFKSKLFPTSRHVWILISTCVAFFSSMCAFDMLAPFFTFEGKKKNVSNTITGYIFSVYPLVQVFACPLVGKWMPSLGLRFTLLAGAFFGGSTLILFGFVEYIESGVLFVSYCFVLRIATALGSAALDTASITLMSVTFKDNLNFVFGLMETFSGVGLMAGPAIGGILFQIGGFKLPFIFVGCLLLILVPLLGFTLPSNIDQPISEGNGDEEENTLSIFSVILIPGVFVDCFVTVIFAICCSSLEMMLTDYLEILTNNNLSSVQVGLVFLINPMMYSIGAPLFGYKLDKKISGKVSIIIGSCGCFISLMLIGPSPLLSSLLTPSLTLTCISLGAYGILTVPMYVPVLSDMQTSAEDGGVPPSFGLTGILSGLFSSSYYIGNFIGPTIAGWLRERLSFEWTITIFSLMVLPEILLVVIYVIWINRKKMITELKRNSVTEEFDDLLSKREKSASENVEFRGIPEMVRIY